MLSSRPELFMLRQLEEEIEKMLSMDGLRRKDHVLELNRLMLRAESVEHRLSLLKIIQVAYLLRLLIFLLPTWLVVYDYSICDAKFLSFRSCGSWVKAPCTGTGTVRTSMLVVLIVGLKCMLDAWNAAPWWVTVSMLTGLTDARPLHYAFARHAQHNKVSP